MPKKEELAVLLTAPPLSGSVPEEHFGQPGGRRIWVRFCPPDAEDWAGDFRADGINHRYGVCRFADGKTVLVIAGGRGYIVDLQSRQLLGTERSDLWDAVTVPGREFVIAHNYTDLFAYNRDGEVWRSERIALDGIGIDEVTPATVAGQTYLPRGHADDADEWLPFRLNFDGWIYDGPTYASWANGNARTRPAAQRRRRGRWIGGALLAGGVALNLYANALAAFQMGGSCKELGFTAPTWNCRQASFCGLFSVMMLVGGVGAFITSFVSRSR